jgi:lysozyme family protein
VNQGVETAAKLLQAAVHATPDGKIGQQTVEQIAKRPITEVIALFMASRAMRYTQAGDFARYGFDWFARLFRADAAALKASAQ